MDELLRWQTKAALTFLIAAVLLIVGGGALYFFLVVNPVHRDPAKVPSKAAEADLVTYAAAIEQARGRVRALLVEKNGPGLSIAIAVDGKIVWAEGFGYSNVERREPLTPVTRFHLGSVSKTLTAAAIALLYDRKRIDLDAPIQRYVPSYPEKPWTVTPRQLLGDVAGVHKIRGDNNDQPPFGHCTSIDEALKTFAEEPLLFKPGTSYRFSSNGWVLLSAAIEGAAGEPFAAFMTRDVLDPLGMTRTILDGSDPNPDLVSVYDPGQTWFRKMGLESDPPMVTDYSCFWGAGAFLSTPSDLVRLGSAMLKPGLLKAETLEVFQQPLRLESGASTGFALGWTVETIPFAGAQARVLRHRATPFAGAVSLRLFPERKLVVAAAADGVDLQTLDPFVLKIAELFASGKSGSGYDQH